MNTTYLNILLPLLLIFSVAVYSPVSKSAESGNPFVEFGITANNFMFYYRDLEGAVNFYEEVLGLKKVLDYGSAVMFQMADTSYITLVRGSEKKHKLAAKRPVTISLVTDELEQWYSYLSKQGLTIKHKFSVDSNPYQESFVVLDPAGYYLQFIRINEHPLNHDFLSALALSDPLIVKINRTDVNAPAPAIRATITSFYYRDMELAQNFYEKSLGFNVVARQNSLPTYHTSPSGYFRLVDATHGLHKPTADISQRKGVMLSLYTDNVDAWFDLISRHEEVVMRTPEMVDIANLREFSFNDTGDYAVEFNFFKMTEANRLLLELLHR
jgi:catechol 2,3-dioxygenase-like lactoylglutathione lyase family enzyme